MKLKLSLKLQKKKRLKKWQNYNKSRRQKDFKCIVIKLDRITTL